MEFYIYGLVLFLVIILLNQKLIIDNFEAINSNEMDTQKLSNFDFPKEIGVIELNDIIECNPKLMFKYGFNQQYIWNDGESVTIDILRQTSRNYMEYNDKRFSLSAIKFSKSNILDNGKAYILQMELIHASREHMCNFKMIVPLKFSPTSNLNIVKKEEIPQYTCCVKTYGDIVKSELGFLGSFLQNSVFKKLDLNKNKHILVSQPLDISVDLALDILEKLKSKVNDKISKESSWLDIDFMEV